jgi:hypothetical protein
MFRPVSAFAEQSFDSHAIFNISTPNAPNGQADLEFDLLTKA